ncbi:glycosyltransferase [Flavimaricola marinus]|uniref:Galactofuranosyl transferase GlfT2 n=1 Tax=Flavimaricola marinus TaxID=1819565 RepID=A0A238LHL7_9RHOB|nr:glycosyltransferase [Flavimaricola marinus]SMY09237.1 Galactofuranosyl transferase GlfT2 [Flavimaricola marinus]
MLSLRRKRPTPSSEPPSKDVTDASAGRLILQRLTLPDPAISDQTEIFVRLDAGTALDLDAQEVHFRRGGTAAFDTYMALFNLGTWAQTCQLDGLQLDLTGDGAFDLRVVLTLPDDVHHALYEGPVTLSAEPVHLELAPLLAAAGAAPDQGLVTFELTAREAAVLTGGSYSAAVLTGGSYSAALPAPVAERAPLNLAMSITTFRREADVTRTVARICAFLDGPGAALLEAMGADVHLFVVDNGQSVSLPAHPRLTLIQNANLGGAGGFARGLAAAQDGGFSHCLFMDDDASFQMESLVRTLAFLRLAHSPKAAVAGAMISAGAPWAIWENGAVFDRFCRPEFNGTDLRDPEEVATMELAASQPKPAGFYGGWWYFAFPLDQVKHYPFPFFVRGDDISFSLAHPFEIVTLSGVVSFQEDFSAKESPQTLYLDLRNHLHQHMVHDGMEIGAMGTARIALWFIARSLVRMHYDSAEAQLMSWADLMQGPAFFAENADMAAKRPQIGALIRDEAWQDIGGDLPEPQTYREPGRVSTILLKLSLNGHLIPGWRLIGKDRVIPIRDRGLIWPIWGLRRADFIDRQAGRHYTVQHSKRRFFALGLRTMRQLWRWIRLYPGLKQAYKESYGDLASRRFWQSRFLPDPTTAPGHGTEQPAPARAAE